MVKTLPRRAAMWVRSVRHHPPVIPSGINLVKPSGSNGMAHYAQLIERSLSSSRFSVQNLVFDDRAVPDVTPSAVHGATIASVNPGHLILAALQYPNVFSSSIKRAAVVIWDVDLLPVRLRMSFRFADELWAPSSMGAENLRNCTTKDVHVIPTPILRPAEQPPGRFRREFGLRDKFLIAYMFDIGSSSRRKNAVAAIRMYRSAFPRDTGETHLILKCTRADPSSTDWMSLKDAAGSRSDISLINEFWTRDVIDAMYTDIDCYLSPHRSEGYGLTVADAVAHGTYVIATAYGGPVDFLPSDLCGMIPYRLVEVGRDRIYPNRARWADPNHDVAVALLREAFESREDIKLKGRHAQEQVLQRFTLENTASWIENRIVIGPPQ